MVKQVRITLENEEHQHYLEYKKDETWNKVLKRGIESLAYFPHEMDWIDAFAESELYTYVTNEEGELK